MIHAWAPFRRDLPRVVFGHTSVRSRACLALSRADGFDNTFANENSCVWNFSCRGQCSGGMQQNRRHWQVNIVTEIPRAAKRAKAKSLPLEVMAKSGYLLFAAISILLSFRVSPSTVPLTVT